MTENEQIEEMAREMCHLSAEFKTCQICNNGYPIEEGELCYFQCIAKEILTHDYRKVERGEWKDKRCTKCGEEMWYKVSGNAFVRTFYRVKSNFCPNCGADMRGEKE